MSTTELAKEATMSARRAVLPLLHRLRPTRYTDAHPYRVLRVPPSRISRMQKRWSGPLDLPWLEGSGSRSLGFLRRRWHAGSVLGGDWDLATRPFEDHHLTEVFRARFVEGEAWEDIPYVQRVVRKTRRGERAWGGRCASEDQVWARCRYLDRLHDALQKEGYRPPGENAADQPRFTDFMVNIGRDGSIIRNNDGKHRIVLSRLLGLPALRARVLIRHRAWQRIRDRIRKGDAELARVHAGHPDLEDLRGMGQASEATTIRLR